MTQSGAASLSREYRTLRGGSLVIVALVLGFRGVPAWRQAVVEERARATELEAAVDTRRRLIAGTERGDSLERALGDSLAVLERTIFMADGMAGATSELSDSVRAAIDDADAKTSSLDVTVDSGGLRRAAKRPIYRTLRLRTELNSDIDGLTRFLLNIESAPQILSVTSVNVSTSDVFAVPSRPELLRAEIVLRALASPATAHLGKP